MGLLYFFGIWALGWLVCLMVLIKWGEKLGIDYGNDPNRELDYSNYDDYTSNQTAYPTMSLAWPMLLLFGIGYGVWKGMTAVTVYLMIKLNKKELKEGMKKGWFYCELSTHPAHDKCKEQCGHCKREWEETQE